MAIKFPPDVSHHAVPSTQKSLYGKTKVLARGGTNLSRNHEFLMANLHGHVQDEGQGLGGRGWHINWSR